MLSGILLSLASLWMASPVAAASPIAAAPLAAPQQGQEAFIKRFEQAIRLADRVGQDRAVQQYRKDAFDTFMLKVETASEGDEWIEAFIGSWKRVYRSDFPKNYASFLRGLNGEQQTRRGRAVAKLAQLYEVNRRAISSRDPADWQIMIEGIEQDGILLEFMDLGDHYYQAICQMFLSYAYNTAYRDGGGDDFQALKAVEAYLKARKELDLTNDPDYSNMERLLAEVQDRLGIEVEPKGEREVKESPYTIHPAEGAEWIDVPLEVGVLEKLGSVELPSDIADEDFKHWLYFVAAAEGAATQIFSAYGTEDNQFGGPAGMPINVKRLRGNKFVIDAGAGESEEFSVGGKPKLVQFEQKLRDGETVPRAIMVATGAEQDELNGLPMNLGLSPEGGIIFYRSVATREGKTPFGDLVLHDSDADGLFGRYPSRVGASPAMPAEVYYNRFDGITFGKSKVAMPFSRWITDGTSWYELEWPKHAGKAESVRIRQAAPTTGVLDIKFKGPKGMKLVSLVLRSESRKTEGLYVDVSGKGPFELPIGRYVLVQGMLRGKDGAECIIQPPSDLPFSVIVDAGDPAVLELGKPFKLVAEPVIEDDQVFIDRESVRVVGIGGETYMQNLYGPLEGIEVDVKGGKSFTFEPDTAENASAKWHLAFFPVSGSAPLPKSGKAVVRLSLKKHPWFGKLQSDWIGEDD